VGHVWDKTNACEVFVGKHEGKRPLRRRKCRWEGDIKMDFNLGNVWIYMAQCRDEWRTLMSSPNRQCHM
jgi:hypothetical protein